MLAFGEFLVAVLARDRDRARAVTGAWRWNFRRLGELSVLRGQLAEHRLFPDAEVRRLQVRGSARLSSYFSRLSHQGLNAANAVAARERPEQEPEQAAAVAVLTGSVGSAFSEDADFDDLDDLGRRSGRDRFGRRVRASPLTTGRQRTLAVVIAFLVIVVGTRDLFFGTLPLVGQLAPLPSWSTSWHHFFSGWQSAGVGTTAPASPAFGLLGLSGTVLFGAMGTLQRVLLLGCIPLGAWGVSRCLRPLVSPRARVVAVICYLGLPLPYGALGLGRWDGLVAYAAFPFIALRLARAAGVEPYAVVARTAVAAPSPPARSSFSAPSSPPRRALPPPSSRWSSSPRWPGCSGVLLVGARGPTWRVLVVAVQAVVVALVLALPWVVGTALAGKGSVAIFGLPLSGATAPSWGDVIRFAVGPVGPLAHRLAAGGGRGAAPGHRPRHPAGLGLAPLGDGAGVLGHRLRHLARRARVVHAFGDRRARPGRARRRGVRRHRHRRLRERPERPGVRLASAGQRRGAPLRGGRPAPRAGRRGRRPLGSPVTGSRAAFGLPGPAQHGRGPRPVAGRPPGPARRVAGRWTPGLAYALTPRSCRTRPRSSPRPVRGRPTRSPKAVRLAVAGGTVHLGRLLAPAGVRYVVVVDALAPSLVGSSPASVSAPPPAGLNADLLEQDDLQVVPGVLGAQVYENGANMPVTATRATALPVHASAYPSATDVAGWQPVLSPLSSGGPAAGAVPAGTLYAGYAPAGSFSLDAGRAHGGAAAGVRLGGAVRGQCQGRGHPLALAVPLRSAGGARWSWPPGCCWHWR